MLKITLMGAWNATSTPQLPEQSQASPQTQPTPEPCSQNLKSRIKQSKKEFTEERDCREAIMSTSRPQFTPFYMTDFELWNLEAQTLSCGR